MDTIKYDNCLLDGWSLKSVYIYILLCPFPRRPRGGTAQLIMFNSGLIRYPMYNIIDPIIMYTHYVLSVWKGTLRVFLRQCVIGIHEIFNVMELGFLKLWLSQYFKAIMNYS